MVDAHESTPPAPGADDVPEQVRVRRGKRRQLLERGVSPYPVGVPCTHSLHEVVSAYDVDVLGPDHHTGDQVAVAGRVIFVRDTGKLCFVRLRAGDGTELQAMLSLIDVGAESLDDFKAFVDIGDHLFVEGEVVTSRRGELSVQVRRWQLAAKSLRPLPNEHRPLSDEARARLRYVDMIVRPEARRVVRTKATVLRSLRSTLDLLDFVEVETPVLQLTNGGAAARPFRTRLNAFNQDMLLRIALELDLKKAVVGGVERVYEIGRTFRNEGLDSTHAAEFSMLEAYQAYGDYDTMAQLLQHLVTDAAQTLGLSVIPTRDGSELDLTSRWRHAALLDLVAEAVDDEVTLETPLSVLRAHAARRDVALQAQWEAADVILELYEKLVEHTLIAPTFVKDYPAAVKPLAQAHRTSAGLVEALDLVVNGVELATAYSEMNDPVLQRERLLAQSLMAAQGNPEAMELDEDFLRALEFGLPPTGGMGMGVDRLVMLLTGLGIRDTILFPLLRPE
ncbi:MAG: lysine--tRNA ligase [Nocardioidaceae bacterium]